MALVPPELTGAWRREVITTPAGYRDETTQVLWVQARSWYADLRVRADRPTRQNAAGFADYTDAELVRLAAVQGFAGELSAGDGVCLWRRDLDYQPPSDSPDEARFAVDGEVMIEDGIHSDYQEIWRREPQSGAPLAVWRLAEDPACPGRAGLLVLAGDHFLQIQGRALPLPAGQSLAEIVTAALDAGERGAAEAALSMRIAYGRREAGDWRVRLSSFPWLEGTSLWGGETVRYNRASGAVTAPGGQVWTLLDSDVSPAAMTGLWPAAARTGS
jgi:hypothetical protein